MSQNIDIKKLGTFVIIGLGILFAFLAGNYVADEDYGALIAVIGGVAAASTFFGLGRRLYLLIPICWGLTGKIGVLPIPFSIAQLVIIASSAYFIADIIFQKRTEKAPFEMIDLWLWINLLYLVTVFFRNPVGFAFLGSGERVGGIPYVNIVLATLAYLILSRVRITPDYARKLPFWILAVAAFSAFAGSVALFYPEIGITLGRLYSSFAPSSLVTNIEVGETRFAFLGVLGIQITLYAIAQTDPLSFIHIRYFGTLCLYLSGLVMTLMSGFRSAIIQILLSTTLSAFLHGRFLGVVKIAMAVFAIILGAIFFSFTSIELPLTAQRALCFLPGNWDPEAVRDAKNSSEWRFEMWEIALTSEKYIHNKIFGDGFGFMRADYERGLDLMHGVTSLRGDEAKQEMFLLDGDFHSGPICGIRFVGYVGLVMFLVFLFITAVYAYKVILISINTPFQTCAFFMCIPVVICPFVFIFIYGMFKDDFPSTIYNVGIMKMLLSSIQYYKKNLKYKNSEV
jgi:hypothetical protein